MKKARRLLSLLIAALLVFSLMACGKDKPTDDKAIVENPDLIRVGEYDLFLKNAEIVKDYDGLDAILLTLDYTNNSKSSNSYLWSVSETVTQNGTQLEPAVIFLSEDSVDLVTDSQYTEIKSGETLEVQSAYVLNDLTGELKIKFEEVLGSNSDQIVIDLSDLGQGTGGDKAALPAKKGSDTAKTTGGGDELLEWWNGPWYGWWTIYGCSGDFEELESQWCDICGVVELGSDYSGTFTIWDESFTESEPMVIAEISLSESGTGAYGTVMSEGGYFMDMEMEHADWIIDPGIAPYDNMILIDGSYGDFDNGFTYEIYLRPWGADWEDVDEADLPYFYYDWYLPMVEAGEDMPGSIAEGM